MSYPQHHGPFGLVGLVLLVVVEVVGIEPTSLSLSTVLLRAQPMILVSGLWSGIGTVHRPQSALVSPSTR
jgi:hypothetical protein